MKKCKNLFILAGLALFLVMGCGNDNKQKTTTSTNQTQKPSSDKTTSQSQDAKTDKGQDAKTDKDQNTGCKPGFFGPDCKPCTCSEHGACNDGKDGDGKCKDCDSGFYGENCQNECACDDDDEEDKVCDDGPEGFGCVCVNNNIGDNCDIPIKCQSGHGELNPANGHCKKCNDNWDGEDCDKCKVGWAGTNCDGMADSKGKIYKVSKIGEQIWMAENMASDQATGGSQVTCTANTDPEEGGVTNFVALFGCLYNWEDALKVCPAGWHLPTQTELNNLLTYMGGC